jgi:hypothetical protein
MNTRRKLFARAILAAYEFVGFSAFLAGALCAQGDNAARPQRDGKIPIRISVQNKNGIEIAASVADASLASATSVSLAFDREYQLGDHIVVRGPRRMAVRFDQNFSECLLYLPDSSLGKFNYELPFGRAEEQTGSAYAPDSFAGRPHRVTARVLSRDERTGYRNLALNPCDAVLPEDAHATAYPHSSTNSYARNLFDFAARNAIDGVEQNGHHGVWPYQSWGPERLLDSWWKLDFGRPVELNKIALMNRADYPHDSFWKSAVVEFSDGSRLPIQITSSASLQEFRFSKRKVTWFRITKLEPEDPATWCSFIEVEAWGDDLR